MIEAKVGQVLIGRGHPIAVQTMCNTHTGDVEASFRQCMRLAEAGADIIRLTVQGMNEVAAIGTIRKRLREAGVDVPLVADIHFRSDVALAAAKTVEKVRVNPGNFNKNHEKAREDFVALLEICRQHGTAIRIGINHGSLGERITSLYGNTPRGMAEAAMEWLRMCIEHNFFNVVVSLKASNVLVMVQAYRELAKMMQESGYYFPLHLGVTEAGNADAARLKSAVGISTLLAEGLGDTVRVSLTEDPAEELPVGHYIASKYRKRYDGRDEAATAKLDSWNKYLLDTACHYGADLLDRRIDDVELQGAFGADKDEYLRNELLQACRRKFYRPEYVACPGCGRTMFNLEKAFNQVKEATASCGNICIAVMGCIVNGPGEMADADFGYIGEGRGLVSIYKGSTPVYRHIPEDEAVGKLLELISSSSI